MTQEDLINVFKYIVKRCDMLINNSNYEADAYTQDIVEDIAELCNHILDVDYGKLVEVKDMDLDGAHYKPLDEDFERDAVSFCFDCGLNTTPYIAKTIAKHFFELGLKTQKGE